MADGAGPARAVAGRSVSGRAGAGRPGAARPGESVYSEALGAEIVAAVSTGRSLRAVCDEPGRPHRTTVKGWERRHPAFGAAMRLAYMETRVSGRMRDRQQKAERAAAEAARQEAEGPPRRGGKASSYTKALGEAICERLAAGASLTEVVKDPDMPCYGTVMKWVKRHPAFETMYVAAREAQGEFLFDEARDVAKSATRESVAVSRLQFDVIRWQAARLAPKKYLERLVAAEAMAGAKAEAATRTEMVFHITRFEVGPKGRVLAAPPRNERELQAWIDDTGAPYAEGVGPKGEIRPPLTNSVAALAARSGVQV